MTRRYPNLPSLHGLRCFEAAARFGSFSEAGRRELCLSPSAVGKQVAELEEALSLKLFERGTRRIDLTDEGERLAVAVRSTLDRLSSTLAELQPAPPKTTFRLGTLPGIGERWLLPRLATFTTDLHLDVELISRHEAAPWRRLDLALLYGDGRWEGCSAKLLLPERLEVVMSPTFARRYVLPNAEAIWDSARLHNASIPDAWDAWARTQGIRVHDKASKQTLSYFGPIIELACAGKGIALVPPFLVEEEIRGGSLIRWQQDTKKGDQPSLHTTYGYYLVSEEERARDPRHRQVGAWLQRLVAMHGRVS